MRGSQKEAISGQITIADYLKENPVIPTVTGCSRCICRDCLYWWSGRCPYGGCYDNYRAKAEPYDKMYPGKSRTGWSSWQTDQAFWCRGGTFYITRYCEHFVNYEGQAVEPCVGCNIQVFQDGYVVCSLKDSIGCEECIARTEGKENENIYDCQYMTDSGCERMITAKSLILDAILDGEDMGICKEQCCKGCTKTCRYRCGQI